MQPCIQHGVIHWHGRKHLLKPRASWLCKPQTQSHVCVCPLKVKQYGFPKVQSNTHDTKFMVWCIYIHNLMQMQAPIFKADAVIQRYLDAAWVQTKSMETSEWGTDAVTSKGEQTLLQLAEAFGVILSCMTPWMYGGRRRKSEGLEETLGNWVSGKI